MENVALRNELAEIFADLQIHSYASYTFRGMPYAIQDAAAYQQGPDTLQESLRGTLYSGCYIRPVATEAVSAQLPYLLPQLMQANPTRDRWDPGWQIYQLNQDGRILVQKGERSRAAVHGEYATSKPPGFPPQVGDIVNLRVHPGSAAMQAGFYYAFGDTLSDQFDDSDLLRFYFNVTAAHAAALMNRVMAEFNRYQVPFRFKTLTEANGYLRADAAVLYCAKRYYRIAADIVNALPDEIAAGLRAPTPMFTLTLRPGIGLAEEPGTGESFGLHRCRLVAEGVLDAWSRGEQTPTARLLAVEQRFTAAGFHLDHPYLQAGSANLFDRAARAGGITP